MTTARKSYALACLLATAFLSVLLLVLPAIPGRPSSRQLRLVQTIEKWGGRASIHNGLLRGVDLSGAMVHDEDLAVLRRAIQDLEAPRSIREIRLADTHITDGGVANLVGLSPHQLALVLDRTKISDGALAIIARSFVGLHSLSLAETAVTEEGLAGLKNCPDLATVIVSGPNINIEVLGRLNEPNRVSGPRFLSP